MLALLSACGAAGGGDGTIPPKEGGDIATGVVRLAPGVELPRLPPAGSELQPPMPESCSPASERDRMPVRMGDDRTLEGVLVQASEFAVEVTREPVEHEVVIRDCRLEPRLVPAVRGDTLVVKNESDYPFLPTIGRAPMMQAVLPGQTRSFPLQEGGVHTLSCGFAAPCGRTDVIVVYHPLHTVTGEGGRFRLKGLPADHSLELHAWHPLFEDSMLELAADARMEELELVLTPLAPPAPPPDAGVDGAVRSEDQPGLF
jgi:hypothetical protein